MDTKFAEMATQAANEMRQVKCETPQSVRALEDQAAQLEQAMHDIRQQAHDQFFYMLVKEVVEKDYDVGEVIDIYEVFGGWVNRSYGIYTMKNGERQTWFVRMYLRGKTIDQLLFEHDVLSYLKGNGFELAACPINTNDGKTYTTRMVDTPESDGEELYYFSVFNYIGGSHTYGWMPGLWQDGVKDITVESLARTQAQIHSMGFGFDPKGRCGDSWSHLTEDIPMNEMMRRYPQLRHEYRQAWGKNGVDSTYLDYFDSHEQFFADALAQAVVDEEDHEKFVKTICHNDYHCDNSKYNDDGTVSGVYDFDSSKLDARIFDLGEAIHNQLASWRDEDNGAIDMRKLELYLRCYNDECEKIGRITPLNEAEKKCLQQELIQGAVYLDWWCTSNVNVHPDVNGFEFVYYSRHFVAAVKWLQGHKQEVDALAARL